MKAGWTRCKAQQDVSTRLAVAADWVRRIPIESFSAAETAAVGAAKAKNELSHTHTHTHTPTMEVACWCNG